ncbi:hypothetical protein ABI_42440 [Asticcacaulis biprosthecium C19]|uniref:Uncharacterized protein n=1 Tax=Asticcacaulis biprosthecium C19 TaxID=715226 RepID=F4QSV1_9CAUL|nr:hypothetical protein [Asticcacaulis biprosthecium]EGF89821.1 hypothetical protein ABI_42440 [Asticcacaulis biprosthecium C19]
MKSPILAIAAFSIAAVLPMPALAQSSEAEGIMASLQSDYDYAMAVGKEAADAYDNGDYAKACSGFRSAANMLDSVATRAYNTSFKLIDGIDHRELLAMSKDVESFANDTHVLAAEVCEEAGS